MKKLLTLDQLKELDTIRAGGACNMFDRVCINREIDRSNYIEESQRGSLANLVMNGPTKDNVEGYEEGDKNE